MARNFLPLLASVTDREFGQKISECCDKEHGNGLRIWHDLLVTVAGMA